MVVAPAEAKLIPVAVPPPEIRAEGPEARVFRAWALGLQRGLE
ncbi:MAG: hypothetical protein ACRDRI_00600 [Pseudonocardiaceae bacterium]